MANYKIEDVEGIGPTYGEKLRNAGINDTDALLASCNTKKQRAELADKADISDTHILKWANMVDLYRITGVGSEFAELLEASGVDTVPELAQRNAANLAEKMIEVNDAKKLCRRTPTGSDVEKWVAEAKTLPRALEY
jgi:predicted flap endonuclease-1-like 5' DNA nuclease